MGTGQGLRGGGVRMAQGSGSGMCVQGHRAATALLLGHTGPFPTAGQPQQAQSLSQCLLLNVPMGTESPCVPCIPVGCAALPFTPFPFSFEPFGYSITPRTQQGGQTHGAASLPSAPVSAAHSSRCPSEPPLSAHQVFPSTSITLLRSPCWCIFPTPNQTRLNLLLFCRSGGWGTALSCWRGESAELPVLPHVSISHPCTNALAFRA